MVFCRSISSESRRKTNTFSSYFMKQVIDNEVQANTLTIRFLGEMLGSADELFAEKTKAFEQRVFCFVNADFENKEEKYNESYCLKLFVASSIRGGSGCLLES